MNADHILPPTASSQRRIVIWLYAITACVAIMVIVGGITRLTDSGLSITEWNLATGILPPLSDAGWAAEFDKYKASGEYQLQNAGMSMAAFKWIYFWEWFHRLLGRMVGLIYAVPFFVFLAKGQIPKWLQPRLWLLLALGGLQGVIGWWMVKSGLVNRVDVLPERLATHFGLAILIIAILIWTIREVRENRPIPIPIHMSSFVMGLVYIQILLGALVAGNDAGMVYNDWPLMGGQIVPAGYWDPGLGVWGNLFHNPAMVQFHHRLGGYVIAVLSILMLCRYGRAVLPFFMVVGVQVMLGIVTLVLVSPFTLALLHQAVAVVLMIKVVMMVQRLRLIRPQN